MDPITMTPRQAAESFEINFRLTYIVTGTTY